MTDDPIFTPFEGTPAPTDAPAPDRPKRRKGNKRGPKAKAAQPAAASEAPKTRNRRAGRPPAASRPQTAAQNAPRRSAGPAPRDYKIDFALACKTLAGLKEDEANMIGQFMAYLDRFPKKRRPIIVAALGKVFA